MCTFRLRAVTAEDAKTLFDWTNDPVTRQNSFQSKPVLWEEHIAWLQRKLEDENCFFFILTDGERDYGTIRVDYLPKEGYGLISFSVAPGQRGKGHGRRMLFLLENFLKEFQAEEYKQKRLNLTLLRGEVKKENTASRRCFEANGYKVENEISGELIFSKRI